MVNTVIPRIYRNNLTKRRAFLVSCHTKKAKTDERQTVIYKLRYPHGKEIEVPGAKLRTRWTWQR